MLLDDTESRAQAMSVMDKTDAKAVMAVIAPLEKQMEDIQREIDSYTEEREPGMICYWALEMKRVQQEFDALTKGTCMDSARIYGCLDMLKATPDQPRYLGLPVYVDCNALVKGHRIYESATALSEASESFGEPFTLLLSSHDFVQLELRGEIEWPHG